MILFVDNDIFLKLAGCYLLHEFMDCLSLDSQQIYVAPDLKFSIQNQMKKRLQGEQADSAKEMLSQFLNNVKQTDVIASDEQQEFLNHLSAIPKIDAGEAILLTHAYFNTNSKIATGDKSCLTAIMNNPSLLELQNSLNGRIYTLEIAMLMLIERLGLRVSIKKLSVAVLMTWC